MLAYDKAVESNIELTLETTTIRDLKYTSVFAI